MDIAPPGMVTTAEDSGYACPESAQNGEAVGFGTVTVGAAVPGGDEVVDVSEVEVDSEVVDVEEEVVYPVMIDTSDIPEPYKTVTTSLSGRVTVWVLGGTVHESKSGPSSPNANPKPGSTA